jgi:molybdopterin molybdotransferase
MAQLSDNSVSAATGLMSLEEALAAATEQIPAVSESENVALEHAIGRIAFEDVVAKNHLPPFINSAVDGYAVRFDDLMPDAETELPVGGRIPAGSPLTVKTSGHAVRIFTGAAMPPDADTVFMQEDVRSANNHVRLPPGLTRGANTRFEGEDVRQGERIIAAGQKLRPQDLALAAATGHAEIKVRRKLRVALLSTGNELVEPGGRLATGHVYDSNRVMLSALLTKSGVAYRDFGIIRDDRNTLADRLAAAAEGNDLVLSSGGVSLGEEDHVKSAVEAAGRMVLWRIAIKPGRPLAMGAIGSTPFVGLPGNPAAVYVTFLFFVRPLLAHIGGAFPQLPFALRVRAGFSAKKKTGRREFIRVSVSRAADGVLEARKFPKEGAALLSSLTESDGLAEIPDNATEVSVGQMISFYPHNTFW